MARTYEVSFQLGAQMAGNFARTMSNASGALGQLNDHIGDLSKQQSSIQSLTRLREQVGRSSREYNQARERVAELGRELSATENPSRELTREFEKAERQVTQTKNRLNDQRESLRNLDREMGTAGQSTRELVARQRELEQQAEKARSAQAGLQRTMAAQQDNVQRRDNLRGQLFDAAGMAVALAAPIRGAVQFESTMADVNKVAGLQADQLAQLERRILSTSNSTGIARDQIAAMYESAAQAGYARKKWDAYVDTASKMAVAFDMSGEASGEMLRAWRSGMTLTMDEATALANTVNHLSNNMNANAAAVGEVIQRQGAVAQQAGLTEQEVAGLSAAFLSSGTSPEIAATALKNFTGALTSGEAATKRQRDAFSALGLDAMNMAEMMQEDATGAINKVLEALNQAPDERRGSLLSMLAGEESKGAIAPLVGNIENFQKAMTLAIQETDSMQEEYNTRSQTTERNLARMAQTARNFGATLGSVLLPPLNSLSTTMTPVIATVAEWADKNPALTSTIVGITAALVAGKVAAIAGGFAFTYVKGAALSVVAVMKTMRVAYLLATGATVANTQATRSAIIVSKIFTAAQWLLNATVAAGKWVWATAKLVAYKAAQLAASGVMRGLAAAQWLLNAAVAAGKWVWATAKLAAYKVAQLAASGVMRGLAAAQWLLNAAVAGGKWAWATAKMLAYKAAQLVASGVMKALTAAQWLLNAALSANPIGLVIAAVAALVAAGIWMWKNWDRVTQFFTTAWDNLTKQFSGFDPLSLIQDSFNRMMNWIENFSLFESGQKLLSTLSDGIKSMVSSPIDAVKGSLSGIRDHLPFSDAKVGPLSELTKSGSSIMTTLSQGMSQVGTDQMMRPFNRTAGDMVGGFQSGIGGAVNRLSSVGRGAGGDAGAGGGMTVQVTQNINVGADAGADVREQARQGASEGADDLIERLRGAEARERRLSYA